jgi:uncharacterized membrane protein
MLNPGLIALALMRFGFGRGGGLFELIVLLAVAGIVAWALTRPAGDDKAGRSAAPMQPKPDNEGIKS